MQAGFIVISAIEVDQVLALWRAFNYSGEIQLEFCKSLTDKRPYLDRDLAYIPRIALPVLPHLSRCEFGTLLYLTTRYIPARGYARAKTRAITQVTGFSRQNTELAIKTLESYRILTKLPQHPNCLIAHGSKYLLGIPNNH